MFDAEDQLLAGLRNEVIFHMRTAPTSRKDLVVAYKDRGFVLYSHQIRGEFMNIVDLF